METALFMNGVYEAGLDEIIKSKETNPDRVFYLQPYSSFSIKQFKNSPPDSQNSVPIYISTTVQLNQICYMAYIVGWDNKTELSQARLAFLNDHIKIISQAKGNLFPS